MAHTASHVTKITKSILAMAVAATLYGSNVVRAEDSVDIAADNRLAVRASFGVRSAIATDASTVVLTIGQSINPSAAGKADSYRVISDDDTNYPYEKFVRPAAVKVARELEVEGVEGSPFPRYERTRVTLTLPSPLRAGGHYHIVAQGTGSEMVTGARTAASFVFEPAATDKPSAPAIANVAVLGLRQIDPIGGSIIRLEFGPDVSTAALAKPAAYRVTTNGQPARVLRLGRKSMLDTYLPVGWPFPAISMHEVFLQLDRPLEDGVRVEATVDDSITTAAKTASMTFSEASTISRSIKVNQVGYLTNSPVKTAYLGQWMGSFPEASVAVVDKPSADGAAMFDQALRAAPAEGSPAAKEPATAIDNAALSFATEPSFNIRDAATGKVVFTGKTKLIHRSGQMDESNAKADHSGENVYLLDFTAFKTPGRYVISVPTVGRSLAFDIADDVFEKAFDITAAGVFAQRCGIELTPPFSDWRRIACHDHGIVVTTVQRTKKHELGDLATHVVYEAPGQSKIDPSETALDADTKLLARWTFDDGYSPKRPLVASGASLPTPADSRFGAAGNRVLGPAITANTPVATATGVSCDIKNGYAMSTWFKVTGSDVYHAQLVAFGEAGWGKPKLMLTSSWGVIGATVGGEGHEIRYERLPADEWHHLALSIPPESTSPRDAVLFVDGKPVARGPIDKNVSGETLKIGMPTEAGASKLYFDDVRLYQRPLSDDEVAVLARPRGAKPVTIAAIGGHHDAGDYNPRSHLDVAQTLLAAYEMAPEKFTDKQLNIPESGNGVPDLVDEAAWALKLWEGLQDTDGGVYNGTESRSDPNFIQTVELDDRGDYAFAKDAQGSFNAAGAFAQAARIYKSVGKNDIATRYLDRARRAYAWADAYRPNDAREASEFASAFASPKAYAAAELLHTTGERKFNEDFLTVAVWSRDKKADIERYGLYDQSLAAWAYVNCDESVVDAAVQSAARDAIVRQADMFVRGSSTMAYGFIRNPYAPISWGTGSYFNWCQPILWAEKITGKPEYRYWLVRTADNALGANPLGVSFITGVGQRTVRAPLHNSRYGITGEVIAGMQVQGPNQRQEGYNVASTFFPQRDDRFAVGQSFVDAHFAISMDEPTVNSQAMTVAALGMLLQDAHGVNGR